MRAEPTDVSLVLEFLNTLDVEEDSDVLRRNASWKQWAEERDLGPDSLAAARQARAALRAAAGDPDATAHPARTPAQIELAAHGPVLVTTSAVGAVFAAATRLTMVDQWQRVKICPADTCRWAFYDQSRNRSRTWCAMRVCGNREKARTWRARAQRR